MVLKFIAYALLSVVLTGAVRHYSLRNEIIAIPNERSSHEVPTPSGGGLAFVALFLVLIPWLPVERNILIALIGGGLMVAIVGWIDDRVSLSAPLRAAVHVIAAVWALGWLGGLPALNLGFTTLSLGWLGWPIGIFGIVWIINLYNFMDGIDGIAGGQAFVAAVSGGVLLYATGLTGPGEVAFTLAAVVLGFLVWNWAPAKIFMGDVASGTLGYIFAVFAISADHQGGPPLLIWAILLGVFLVDASATLLRRIQQGERWHDAHRSHAYQLATQMGYSHAQVTMAAIGVMIGLAGLAWVGWRWPGLMVPAAIVAFGGLVAGWGYVVGAEERYRERGGVGASGVG